MSEMNYKNCFVILSEYPYFTTETFFENEVEFLKKEFNNLYIVSINATKNSKQTRQVPKGSIIIPLSQYHGIFKYPYFVIKGLFNKRDYLKINDKKIKKYLSSLYVRGRAFDIYKKIKKVIKKDKINLDNTLVYSYWFLYQAVAAILLNEYINEEGCSSKVISRAHGYDLYAERTKYNFLPFQEATLSKIDKVYTCSTNGKKYLDEKYPGYKDKIEVSYLGTNDYGKVVTKSTNTFDIVTCSQIKEVKNLQLLLDTLKILDKKPCSSTITWTCIGDGPLLDELMKDAQENIHNIKIEFLGHILNYDVIQYYGNNNPSLFANVSKSEGLPVSIMEAISFGIPVLATDVGGTSEVVSKDVGVLVEPDITPEELSKTILNMANTKFDAISIREYWKQKFRSDTNYSNFIKNIKDI